MLNIQYTASFIESPVYYALTGFEVSKVKADVLSKSNLKQGSILIQIPIPTFTRYHAKIVNWLFTKKTPQPKSNKTKTNKQTHTNDVELQLNNVWFC
jgi:hypothetical protein